MRIELRRESYQVTYEALDWLIVAERLEDWGWCTAWPSNQEAGRLSVATWARAVYATAISDRQRFTLTMPRDWAGWLWRVLADSHDDDEFPWTLAPSLVGQIRAQNKRTQSSRHRG
ncbi:hypothetical protein ACFY7C_19385 [Streptomyces sp. NPDC012769]|uniref:hypothetical protein n=1 Tax=Streptomyces sp. NPDC012769 TaxID=3364848 RepID=UPI00369A7C06